MGRMKLAESSGGSSLIPMAISSDNVNGLVLALSSSLFIGASFIIKKKGLKRAGASGVRDSASIGYQAIAVTALNMARYPIASDGNERM